MSQYGGGDVGYKRKSVYEQGHYSVSKRYLEQAGGFQGHDGYDGCGYGQQGYHDRRGGGRGWGNRGYGCARGGGGRGGGDSAPKEPDPVAEHIANRDERKITMDWTDFVAPSSEARLEVFLSNPTGSVSFQLSEACSKEVDILREKRFVSRLRCMSLR